jgi:transcriptional regulator with XRE-family HTH domain
MPGRSRTKTEAKFYRDLGQAIRLARVAAGKTQGDVAGHIGITYQQFQKYENGTHRIPVDKLVGLAAYLDIPLLRLLSLPENEAKLSSLTESLQAKTSHALLESWAGIKHQPMRAALLDVLRCAAALSR